MEEELFEWQLMGYDAIADNGAIKLGTEFHGIVAPNLQEAIQKANAILPKREFWVQRVKPAISKSDEAAREYNRLIARSLATMESMALIFREMREEIDNYIKKEGKDSENV